MNELFSKPVYYGIGNSALRISFDAKKQIDGISLRDDEYYLHLYNANGKYLVTEGVEDDILPYNKKDAENLLLKTIVEMINLDDAHPLEIKLSLEKRALLCQLRQRLA